MPSRRHEKDELDAVGEMIRRLRTSKGMTQQELAFQVGTTPRSVQRWEQRGAPKPDAIDLLKLLDVFGIVVPEAPQLGTISSELRQIRERLTAIEGGGFAVEDIAALADRLSALNVPTIDTIAAIVEELNGPKRPSSRRLAQMREVADASLEASQMAGRVAVALRARLEAAGSGS